MKTILLLIEDMRQKMVWTAEQRGLSDPRVITISQKLDELLNIYYLMQINSYNSKNNKTAI